MQLSDFDFDLPEELIALRPVRPRPASRLLVAEGAATHEAQVADLARWLRPGDMLVFNDTKVLPARLFGERRRETTDGSGIARIETTLIRQESGDQWWSLAKPGKRLTPGDRITFGPLAAEVVTKAEGEVLLRFDRTGAELDAAIAEAGVMPLPPYIANRRAADAQDAEDYQTVFAKKTGAVAAPTASLHFDTALVAALETKSVLTTRLTLHVGAGTFLPVKVENPEEHRMHAEWGEIPEAAATAINTAKKAGGRIIPVGTTALRLIESAADEAGRIRPWSGETDIFIYPGYRFRVTDGLMTNFHLPKSTLFMLVSALMGTDRMQALYAEAIRRKFRFYSYGDSSLLLPDPPLTG
ncbi:MAG: tRNA preQ1(34) S-adenosylmethionine ribosyltransferase-isomerase QueA [Pseudomonadota bacterium]